MEGARGVVAPELARLLGTWQGPETTTTPAGPVASEGTMRFRPACGGRFLVSDYAQSKDGVVSFTGHGVYGWDPAARCVTMHWFDSESAAGRPVVAEGAWEDDVLAFVAAGRRHVRYVYTLSGPDELLFRLEWSADGAAWSSLLEGRYARRAE